MSEIKAVPRFPTSECPPVYPKERQYPGYPAVVIINLPNFTINSRLNLCFAKLGYKVFSSIDITDYAEAFDDYGTNKTEFAIMAKKVWEDNQYDVIMEPSVLYWKEMANHWPNTKFVHVTFNDVDQWQNGLKYYLTKLYQLPDDHNMAQVLANNPTISPTAHHAFTVWDTIMYYMYGAQLWTKPGITWESQHPWDKMLPRLYRMFNADVELSAPKTRTLLNYKLNDGWMPLANFLGLQENENQIPDAPPLSFDDFIFKLLENNGTEYDQKVENEVKAWMRKNGYEIKRISN